MCALEERKTLEQLLLEDSNTADVARDFLALYARRYGADGAVKAEDTWQRLINNWLDAGYGMNAAQTKGIQGLRTALNGSEKSKKMGLLGRIFG